MRIDIKLVSTAGLHAQLASKIVQLSGNYEADIELVYENQTVDAKSILGLMSLAVPKGENVTIIADGNDAEKAIKELKKIIG